MIPTKEDLDSLADSLDRDLVTHLGDARTALVGESLNIFNSNSPQALRKDGYICGVVVKDRDSAQERDRDSAQAWGVWTFDAKHELGGIVSELCAQKHRDEAFERLVSFMSGQCGDMKHIFGDVDRPGDLSDLVDSILAGLGAEPCEGEQLSVPATALEAFDRMVRSEPVARRRKD